MLIKKDRNEQLEKILAQKKVDEQAKNLLQGIMYKVEASYKDYKTVKVKMKTEEKYVRELLENIAQRCEAFKIVKPSEKLSNEEIQEALEKNKFYIGEEILSYPIEEKILYAIEEKSRHPKILNNKYEEATIAISDLINAGKNMDRVEVLRDFNGWSWTTINKEIENIEANLIYQTLQIILGEEFLDNWCQDKDGIIDYLEQLDEEIRARYCEQFADVSNQIKELLTQIAMANTARENMVFKRDVTEKIIKIEEEISEYENTAQKIKEISNHKKQLLQELTEIEKVIGQKTRLKDEYQKRNEEAPIDKKIFNIKVFKRHLDKKKQDILEQIERYNYLLNPENYIEEKNKMMAQKEYLQLTEQSQDEVEQQLIEYIKNFLKCFKILINKTKDEEDIADLIYKFRYFLLLPFNKEKCIKDVEPLAGDIEDAQKKLIQKAIERKVIANVPFEIMRHVFNTRIIKLEDLYYKITRSKDEKFFVQIFDENITEEKFEIVPEEKTKINKKIKIFM